MCKIILHTYKEKLYNTSNKDKIQKKTSDFEVLLCTFS